MREVVIEVREVNCYKLHRCFNYQTNRWCRRVGCRRIGLSASWSVGELVVGELSINPLCSQWIPTNCSLVAFAPLVNGRSRKLAVRRKQEDACWHWSHAHCRHPLVVWTRPTGMQTEPQLEPATSAGVILPETGQFLLLYLLQLW